MGMKKESSNKQDKQEFVVIDLLHIVKSVWHRFWIIVLAAVVAGVAGFSYSKFCITPTYSSSVMLYVNNNSSITGGKFNFNSSELTASKELVDTYIVMLKNRTTLTKIAKDAGVDKKYDYPTLYKMIGAGSVDDTEVLRVTVTSTDYKEAYKIAQSIADLFPEVLGGEVGGIMEGCNMKVVDNPYAESDKVAPNVTRYTAIFMIIGGLIAAIVLVVLALLDDTIHDEDYLLKSYDYPILAKVPNLLEATGKNYSYYYQRKKSSTQNSQTNNKE